MIPPGFIPTQTKYALKKSAIIILICNRVILHCAELQSCRLKNAMVNMPKIKNVKAILLI